MKIIYIAGPFRGATYWEQEQNIRRAEELSLAVWRMGSVGLCPHTNTRFFQGAMPDHVWLHGDLELLRRAADALILAPMWQHSEGAKMEIALAHELGRPVFESLKDLEHWLTVSEGRPHEQGCSV